MGELLVNTDSLLESMSEAKLAHSLSQSNASSVSSAGAGLDSRLSNSKSAVSGLSNSINDISASLENLTTGIGSVTDILAGAESTVDGQVNMETLKILDLLEYNKFNNANITAEEMIAILGGNYLTSDVYANQKLNVTVLLNEGAGGSKTIPIDQYVEGVMLSESLKSLIQKYTDGDLSLDQLLEIGSVNAIISRSYGLYQTYGGTKTIKAGASHQCFSDYYEGVYSYDSANNPTNGTSAPELNKNRQVLRALIARTVTSSTEGIIISVKDDSSNNITDFWSQFNEGGEHPLNARYSGGSRTDDDAGYYTEGKIEKGINTNNYYFHAKNGDSFKETLEYYFDSEANVKLKYIDYETLKIGAEVTDADTIEALMKKKGITLIETEDPFLLQASWKGTGLPSNSVPPTSETVPSTEPDYSPELPIETPTPSTPTLSTPTPSTSTPSTPTPSTSTPSTPTPSTSTPSTSTPSTPTPSTPTPSTSTPSTPTPSTPTPSTPTPSTPTPSTSSPSTPTPSTPTPVTSTPTQTVEKTIIKYIDKEPIKEPEVPSTPIVETPVEEPIIVPIVETPNINNNYVEPVVDTPDEVIETPVIVSNKETETKGPNGLAIGLGIAAAAGAAVAGTTMYKKYKKNNSTDEESEDEYAEEEEE